MQQTTNISSTFSEYCTGYCGFGFNGQEKDQEIYNNQNTTTATFWEYDGRIGRRWNLDPKPTIGISDFAVFANSPIMMGDKFGDSTRYYNKGNLIGITHDKLPNAIVDFSMDEKIVDEWEGIISKSKNKDSDELNKQLRNLGQVYEMKNFDNYMDKSDKDKNKEYKGYFNEHSSFLYQIGNRVLLGKEDYTDGDIDCVVDRTPLGKYPVAKIHNHPNAGKRTPDRYPAGTYVHTPTDIADDFIPIYGSRAYSIVYSPTTIYFYNKKNCPIIEIPRFGKFKR